MKQVRIITATGLLALGTVLAPPASAEVTQLVVEKTTPMPNGYELVQGHYSGALDPANSHDAIITDLKLAPRNAAGKVEYYATFAIAKPVDMSKASGVLVYDVVNRGRGAAKNLGDGHVNVISGWQGDVDEAPKVYFLRTPVLHGITGPAWVRFIDVPAGTTTMDIKGGPQGDNDGRTFEVATAKSAHLYTHASEAKPLDRREVPASDWAFGDCAKAPFPGTPDLNKLCVKGGFNPALAYTLAFTAKDPKVLGVGFAAPRDLVNFLRNDSSAANPLASKIHWTIARGESQSGDYLRNYVHLGFNSSEDGKQVFDGLMPVIAMRSIAMNFRFAAPGGLVDLYEIGLDGVNWWGDYDDRVRGQGRHSLLERCAPVNQCPKVAEVMGAAELRYHRGGTDFVGTGAEADIDLPANVRRYYNASVTHGGGKGGFSVVPPEKPRDGYCTLPANPNPTDFVNRAVFAALVDWVSKNRAPPPSLYPTLAAGDLVSRDVFETQFPHIPGVPRSPDALLNRYDFSKDPHFVASDISGTFSGGPPRFIGAISLLVPRVDADGNETAGIRSPLLAAPLGTYTGWNPVAIGYRTGRYCFSAGGFIPFAKTKAERIAKGDSRLSIEERYPTHADYVARVKAQADKLVAGGYMLADDAAKTVAQAEAAPDP